MATYYEILGVDSGASCDCIKRAFRDKAKLLHPDINSAPAAKANFQQLNEAYQVLSNEKARRTYDIRLRFGEPVRRVYYHNGGPAAYQASDRYARYKRYMEQEEETQGLFEKIFDQFLYLFMLGVGLFALIFGISRLWAEPIEGVNPLIGIMFGALLTGLLIWGWHARRKKSS